MKSMIIVASLLLSLGARAQAISPCLEDVLEYQKLDTPNAESLKCMEEDEDYSKSLSFLCSKDRTTISGEFMKYDGLKKRVDEALIRFQNAEPGVRAVALSQLRNAEQDLEVFGFRKEVTFAFAQIKSVHYYCSVQP